MNVEAYIASGILEAYVLGELPVREQEQVALQLVRYPALRTELERIERTLEHLALQAAVKPNRQLKDAIFDSLNPRLTAKPEKTNTVWPWVAAAALVVACGFAYLAYTYYTRWTSTSIQLAAIELRNQQIAQNLNTVNLSLTQIQAELAVVDNPAYARVHLAGTPQAPAAHATVYWNATTQEVYLRVQHLQALADENQFQLWALIDGKPVDLGIFDAKNGLIKMKPTFRADAFAVTIEARGGSPVPSLHTLQVMGNTKG